MGTLLAEFSLGTSTSASIVNPTSHADSYFPILDSSADDSLVYRRRIAVLALGPFELPRM